MECVVFTKAKCLQMLYKELENFQNLTVIFTKGNFRMEFIVGKECIFGKTKN